MTQSAELAVYTMWHWLELHHDTLEFMEIYSYILNTFVNAYGDAYTSITKSSLATSLKNTKKNYQSGRRMFPIAIDVAAVLPTRSC